MNVKKFFQIICVLIFASSLAASEQTSSDALKNRVIEIRSELKDRTEEVELCVRKNWNQTKSEEKINLIVQINEHGDVMAADVNFRKSTIIDAEVTRCVIAEAKRWHLSASPPGELYRISHEYVIKKHSLPSQKMNGKKQKK